MKTFVRDLIPNLHTGRAASLVGSAGVVGELLHTRDVLTHPCSLCHPCVWFLVDERSSIRLSDHHEVVLLSA